jgi:PhnB protein
MNIEPYLFLNGRTDEAIAFYERALGARVEMVMRFADSPQPVPADRLPPGGAQKVMHSSLLIEGARIMASDGCGPGGATIAGFALSLGLKTEADARKRFAALSEGGRVDLPMGKTFWSPCYGMVTDRFGVQWMVMVCAEQPA